MDSTTKIDLIKKFATLMNEHLGSEYEYIHGELQQRNPKILVEHREALRIKI